MNRQSIFVYKVNGDQFYYLSKEEDRYTLYYNDGAEDFDLNAGGEPCQVLGDLSSMLCQLFETGCFDGESKVQNRFIFQELLLCLPELA